MSLEQINITGLERVLRSPFKIAEAAPLNLVVHAERLLSRIFISKQTFDF